MKIGDRVTRPNVWKLEEAVGTVLRVTRGHVVVTWDHVFGDWHYTNEQAKDIEVVNENSSR